jgi:hypothetical protein
VPYSCQSPSLFRIYSIFGRWGISFDGQSISGLIILIRGRDARTETGANSSQSIRCPPSRPNNGQWAWTLYQVQTTVLSFAQLRQLRFPSNGNPDHRRDPGGRAVLAALGIYAVALQWRDGYQLPSRCQLVPKAPPSWEFIQTIAPANDEFTRFEISDDVALEALLGCVEDARRYGLDWHDGELTLTPNAEFAQLVRESEQYAVEDV